MEHQNNNNYSEESRLHEEEDSNTQHEKLKSFGYTLYKYWMIINAVWTLQEIFWPPVVGISQTHEDFSLLDLLLYYLTGLPFRIWNVMNSLLIFEGMRRKSLNLVSKTVNLMKIYALSYMIISGLYTLSDLGHAVVNGLAEEYLPRTDAKIEKNNMAIVVTGMAVSLWGLCYYFTNIYGAKKVRDVLKAHQKARYSL